MNDRTNLAYILLISGLSSSKRGRLWKQSFQAYFDDAKYSTKFQEFKSHLSKNQDSSEDSREDSRYARISRKASR